MIQMETKIKIGSLNVRGLNNRLKRKSLYKMIYKERFDLMFCQEMYVTESNKGIWETEWGGKLVTSCGDSNARGVGIFISNRCYITNINTVIDTEGRFIIMSCTIDEREWLFVNVYAPNADTPQYFTNLFKQMENCTAENIVMAGDFNLVMNQNLDALNRKHNNNKSWQVLMDSVSEWGLCDTWRLFNQDSKRLTHFQRGTGARLDFFLCSQGLMDSVIDQKISSNVLSDHNTIELVLETDQLARGPGVWRLNVSLLSQEKTLEKIKETIRKTNKNANHLDIHEKWELIKSNVGKIFREEGKSKAHRDDNNYTKLKTILNELDKEKGRAYPLCG